MDVAVVMTLIAWSASQGKGGLKKGVRYSRHCVQEKIVVLTFASQILENPTEPTFVRQWRCKKPRVTVYLHFAERVMLSRICTQCLKHRFNMISQLGECNRNKINTFYGNQLYLYTQSRLILSVYMYAVYLYRRHGVNGREIMITTYLLN